MPRKTKRSIKNKNELPATKKKKKTVSKRQALKLPKTGVFEGLEFESLLELSFIQWAFFLKERGYITKIKRPESYILSEKLSNVYKEGSKRRSQILMRESSYTPDLEMEWDKRKYQDFVWLLGSESKMDKPLVGQLYDDGVIRTIVEIKPKFDRNQGIRIVKDRIKFCYTKCGVYINLVQPELFYEEVFPPPQWLKTTTGRDRQLSYTPKTFEEYIKLRNNG